MVKSKRKCRSDKPDRRRPGFRSFHTQGSVGRRRSTGMTPAPMVGVALARTHLDMSRFLPLTPGRSLL
jgi:hypothetical protein